MVSCQWSVVKNDGFHSWRSVRDRAEQCSALRGSSFAARMGSLRLALARLARGEGGGVEKAPNPQARKLQGSTKNQAPKDRVVRLCSALLAFLERKGERNDFKSEISDLKQGSALTQLLAARFHRRGRHYGGQGGHHALPILAGDRKDQGRAAALALLRGQFVGRQLGLARFFYWWAEDAG
jgi:hypothetical protein